MKKIYFGLIIALVLCSCTKTELTGVEAGEMIIGASMEVYPSISKAALSDTDGSLTWQTGDVIEVATSEGHAQFNLKTGAGTASATFSANYSRTLGDYATYPADIFDSESKIKIPASREWSEDNTNCSMFGSVDGDNVAFKHLGGVVKVTLNGVPADAKKFVFSTPGKKITGEFDIQTETGENGNKYIATSDDSNDAYSSYTLTFTLAEPQNMAFYIPLPCGTYPKFAFKLLGDDAANPLYEFEGISAQTVNRKDILLMPASTIGTVPDGGYLLTSVPSETEGDYILPKADSVILYFEGKDNPGTDEINLKYAEGFNLPKKLCLKVKDGNKVNISGALPNTHVEFDQGEIVTAKLKTSSTTFKIIAPAKISEKLVVKGGNVEISGLIEGADNVKAIEVEAGATADGTSAPVQITIEDKATVGISEQSGDGGITTSANVVIVNNTNEPVNVAVPDSVQSNVQVASAGTGSGEVKRSDNQPTANSEAVIGTQNFFTLSDAVTAAQAGQTITLVKNVKLSEPIVTDKTFTLTLNKDITHVEEWGSAYDNTRDALIIVKRGGDITINGTGKILSTHKFVYAAVKLTQTGELETGDAAKLTVGGDVTLQGYYYGIVGNGNRQNTEITINGGIIKGTAANDNIGIYHPQAGSLTINGGIIEGSTGIVLKGGKLVVNDGTIKGNGESKDFLHHGSGWNNTGDALAVEVCDYPGQNPPQTDLSAEIKGGKFDSTNGKPVASYVQPGKSYTPLAGFIFGGLYNEAPEAGYIALGKKSEQNSAGLWEIVADPTLYVIEEMTAEMVIPEGITHVVASDELTAKRLADEPGMSEDDARNPFFMDYTVTKVSLPASMTPVSGLFYNTMALKEVEFDGSGNLVFENVPIVNSYYVEKITIKNLPETCQFYGVNDNSKPNQYLINLDTPKSDGPKKIEIFLPAGWIEKGYQYKFNSCCATPIYTYEDGKLIGYSKAAKWYTVTEVNENGVQSIIASEDGNDQTAIVYADENTIIPHGVTDLQSGDELMNAPGRNYNQDWPFVQNQTVKSAWIPSTILVKENGKQDFNGAFQHCNNLESITLEGGNDVIYTSFPMIAWCKSIKTVKIDSLPTDFKFQYGPNDNSAVNPRFIYDDGAGMPDAVITVYLPNGWRNRSYQYKFGAQMERGIPTIEVYEADAEGKYQLLGRSVNNVWQDPE